MSTSEKLLQIPLLEKATEDIYKLSVHFPFGMKQVNSYLFKGDSGYTIVDTGSCAKESIAIWEQVMAAGIKVEKLVLTHTHPDHLGLAGWLQKNYGIPVHLSRLSYNEVKRLRDRERGVWLKDFIKQHGGPEISIDSILAEAEAYEFEPDHLFSLDENITLGNDSYEVIHTPGHSADHLCFYSPERQIMVTGDHVLKRISPIIAVWSPEILNPLGDYFRSLDMVSRCQVKLALPGHGELITDLAVRAEEIKSGHMHRLQQTLTAIQEKAKSAGEIYQDVYGKLNIFKFFAPFMTTVSRLIYLESIGKVQSEIKNGKYYYSVI